VIQQHVAILLEVTAIGFARRFQEPAWVKEAAIEAIHERGGAEEKPATVLWCQHGRRRNRHSQKARSGRADELA
jgi:hypothetical protein